MERFRQKRSSKATGAADRSSGGGFGFSNAAPRQGIRQTQNQKYSLNFASGFSSGRNGMPVQDDDLLTFELGHNLSARRLLGTPMKKLLAEEMVKETESKRRPPSIIARLMGLDGLPSQQPAQKQQKGIPTNSQPKTGPIESHRNAVSYDGHHRRRSSKEQQEFKDVFEVSEMPKVEGSNLPLCGAESGRSMEAKIEFIRQKFIDAKRLSTDERLHDSREFHDALEVLDSDKGLLLKILQEPDSLFTKHPHDGKDSPAQSHCTNIAVIRSANALKCEKKVKTSKSRKETSWKGERRSPQKHLDAFMSQSYNRHDVHSSTKPKAPSEGRNGPQIMPTRIVVLKPNVGKSRDGTNSVLSPHSSHAFHSESRKQEYFSSVRHREAELREKENLCNDLRPNRYKCRESRVIAKEVTGRMRKKSHVGSISMSPSYRRGYAGDESSFSMSEYDSANDSDAATSTSRSFFDYNNLYGLSRCHSTVSSVNTEAKKRLSERWKMSRRFLDIGVNNRGNTLGQMLSNSDREMVNEISGAASVEEDLNSNGETVGLVGPLGISSRDGWKDGCINSLSASRSLPASPAAFGSPKITQQEAVVDDRYMIPKEALYHGMIKAREMHENQEDISQLNLISVSRKSQYPRCAFGERLESCGTLLNVYASHNQVEHEFEDNDSADYRSLVPEMSAGIETDTRSSHYDVADVGNEDMATCSEVSENFLQDAPDNMVVKAKSPSSSVDSTLPQELSSRQDKEDSVPLHCPVTEAESLASSKEIDQPSPVSVLEPPFVEDPSSGCECLDRVSADIQGLRMQLQLLKLESESYEEGPMIISSDEDEGASEDKHVQAEERWQSSYVIDVLNHCSFNDSGLMFSESCDSSECPIGPWVFEELEKSYCAKNNCFQGERKLLFDRINSGLIEIYQLIADPHPWVKPPVRMIQPKWELTELEGELCKLLASQEKEGASDSDVAERLLVKDLQWLNLGNDIDVVGKEIEGLLMDQLITEIVVM